jgi:enoyl-CoA hydratase/carnithine racemase
MSLVQTHVHQHTGTLVLNRPDKRNALSRQLIADIDEALHDFHSQRQVRAVVVSGAGPAFCAGMDLAEMQATSQETDALARWHDDAAIYRDLLETMLRFPKPLIATVHGPALAGGLGLVLACDIVLASREAVFGLPEPKRGLVAGVVAPLLAFRIGAGQSAYVLLSASNLDGNDAHRIGLVHEIVKADQLWARANQLAADCAQCAPESLLMTKRMLNEIVGEQLTTQLAAGAGMSATARTTEAAAEGLAAFLEKREPKWR